MRVLRSGERSRFIVSLAAASVCAVGSTSAQEPPESRQGAVWTLEGLKVGQCVRFLINPAAAGKQIRPGTRLIRADQDTSLHQALRTVIQSQPEFSAWAPSSLCLYYADAIRLGSRRLSSKDPRRRQMLGVWAVAATEQGGARRDIVVDLFGTDGEFVHSADMARIKASEARSRASVVQATGNELYDIRIGKTRLVWNGRAAGDSTRVDRPIQELWLTRGASGTLWRVQTTIKPSWSRSLVGVLTVEGKGDLAKALKGSPTRFVGPLYFGGGGELRFSR
jgi:hypothetical protein